MSFVIELDGHGPFSPGETISGNLLCIFINTEIVQDITCSLVGLEQTKLSVQNSHDLQYTDYTGYGVFLKEDVKLVSGQIQPGTYKFPFSFDLPGSGIPSSFKHELGRVWYKIEAIVMGQALYYKTSQTVQVFVSVNLNDMDDVTMVPLTYPIDESVQGGCCCAGDIRISMEMTLEKDAFIVGEIIHIKLCISNKSDLITNSLEIMLLSHTEFLTDYPKRRKGLIKEQINKLNYGQILGQSRKTYSFDLKVPTHLAVPCFNKCILMRRWYTLMVTMVIGDCYSNIELPVKVHLGHIAVDGPRPIGFPHPQLPPGGSSTSNVIPVGQAFQDVYPPAPVNRPPYPMDATSMPTPNTIPSSLPTVQLPLSYSVRQESPIAMPLPMPLPMPRRNPGRISRAPIVEQEHDTLLPGNGDEIDLPPSYDEAIRRANIGNSSTNN